MLKSFRLWVDFRVTRLGFILYNMSIINFKGMSKPSSFRGKRRESRSLRETIQKT